MSNKVRTWALEYTAIVRLNVYYYAICRYKMKFFLGLVTHIHPNGNGVQVMAKTKCAGRWNWPNYKDESNYLDEEIN